MRHLQRTRWRMLCVLPSAGLDARCELMKSSADTSAPGRPRPCSPRRAAPRPDAPRLRTRRPDRRVLGATRRAVSSPSSDRLRGGPDASGGARRDTARGRAGTLGARSPRRRGLAAFGALLAEADGHLERSAVIRVEARRTIERPHIREPQVQPRGPCRRMEPLRPTGGGTAIADEEGLGQLG